MEENFLSVTLEAIKIQKLDEKNKIRGSSWGQCGVSSLGNLTETKFGLYSREKLTFAVVLNWEEPTVSEFGREVWLNQLGADMVGKA